jgi:hypothetical protein
MTWRPIHFPIYDVLAGAFIFRRPNFVSGQLMTAHALNCAK